MPRPKGIYIIERDGKKYARTSYVDEQGRRKTIERAGKNITEMKKRVEKALSDAQNTSPDNQTFEQLVIFYKKHYLVDAEYNNNYKVAGLRSAKKVESLLKPLEEYFNNFKIQKITYFDLMEFRRKRLKTPIIKKDEKTMRSITAVNREMEVLRRILNIAIQKRWLVRNPFTDGEPLILTSAESKRDIIPSSEDEIKILNACDLSKSPYIKPIIIGLIDTGARLNELLNSKRGDYNFDTKTLILINSKGRNIREKKVFITQRFEDILINYGILGLKSDVKVFPIKKIQTAWEVVRRKAGVEHLHLHDLRHAFASNLGFNGVARDTIRNLIGHSPKENNITDRYINLNDEMLNLTREIANKRNELLISEAIN